MGLAPKTQLALQRGVRLEKLLTLAFAQGVLLRAQRHGVVPHQGLNGIGRDGRLVAQRGRPGDELGPVGQPDFEVGQRQRRRNGVALKAPTAHGRQRQRMLRRAHTFADHFQPHQLGDTQQAVGNAQPRAAGEQVMGEAAVDLD